MSKMEVSGDTLLVDGPVILFNIFLPSAAMDSLKPRKQEMVKFVQKLSKEMRSDSITVAIPKQPYIKFTDFYKEFEDQEMNFTETSAQVVFIFPGRKPVFIDKWDDMESIKLNWKLAMGQSVDIKTNEPAIVPSAQPEVLNYDSIKMRLMEEREKKNPNNLNKKNNSSSKEK